MLWKHFKIFSIISYACQLRSVAGVVTKTGVRHRAEYVVMACGAWTPSLVPELDGIVQAVGQPVIYITVPSVHRPLYSSGAFPVWLADIARTGWYVNRVLLLKHYDLSFVYRLFVLRFSRHID